MGESCRFVHFFCVKTEHSLVNIPLKVCLGNEVIRAHYHLAPTLLGDEVTTTLVVVEMVDEGDEGIAMFKCKSHSSRYFYLFIP